MMNDVTELVFAEPLRRFAGGQAWTYRHLFFRRFPNGLELIRQGLAIETAIVVTTDEDMIADDFRPDPPPLRRQPRNDLSVAELRAFKRAAERVRNGGRSMLRDEGSA